MFKAKGFGYGNTLTSTVSESNAPKTSAPLLPQSSASAIHAREAFEKQNSQSANKYTPTNSVAAGVTAPKCTSCAKTVYKMEEVIAVGRVWHNTCFTCGGTNSSGLGCKKTLRRDDYVDHENQPFCLACYAKLFRPKGFGYGNTLNTDYGPAAAATAPDASNITPAGAEELLKSPLNDFSKPKAPIPPTPPT